MTYVEKQFLSIEQTIFNIISGYLAGSLPNKKSNIHPLLLGAIVGFFARKIVYGDYDKGYNWTIYDILFFIISVFLGIFGAFLAMNIKGM